MSAEDNLSPRQFPETNSAGNYRGGYQIREFDKNSIRGKVEKVRRTVADNTGLFSNPDDQFRHRLPDPRNAGLK